MTEDVARRRVLTLSSAVVSAAIAGCSSRNAADGASDGREYVAPADEPDYGDWLADVPSYEGTVDRTGRDEVTVLVGTGDHGYQYDPAAIRIDGGTTVVWEWTGKGGPHDVVETDGAFESENHRRAGATFEHAFDDPGVYRYVCVPHVAVEMKGAVEVV